MLLLLLLSLGIIIAWSVYVRKMRSEAEAEKENTRPTAEQIYSYTELSDELSPQEWKEINDMTDDEYADMIAAYRNEQADEKYGWQEDEDHPWRL